MRLKRKMAGRNLEEFSGDNVGEFMKKDARKKEKEKQINSSFMRVSESIEDFNEMDDKGVGGEIEKGKGENK